jgi:short-subunit dehydrogenase
MATFTKTYHKTSYEAISSSAPSNSQVGRNIVVTGASEGIGVSISRSFAMAKAARVIMVARRQSLLSATVTKVNEDCGRNAAVGKVCDVADENDVNQLWAQLAQQGIVIDVLVLNAAVAGAGSLLADDAVETVKQVFTLNVIGILNMAKSFLAQSVDSNPRVRFP